MNRLPEDVVAGLDRRVKREGYFSRNEGVIQALVAYGDFPEGKRPVIEPVMATSKAKKPSTASKVKTASRPPEAPGSRLNKAAAATRSGPKISKAPVVRAEPEETV